MVTEGAACWSLCQLLFVCSEPLSGNSNVGACVSHSFRPACSCVSVAACNIFFVTKWTHRLEEERVDGDEEGSEPAAHLEHLPAFTERWVPEALTSHVLSQVLG